MFIDIKRGTMLSIALWGAWVGSAHAFNPQAACAIMSSMSGASGAALGYKCIVEPAKHLIRAVPASGTKEKDLPIPTWGSLKGFVVASKIGDASNWELLISTSVDKCLKLAAADAKSIALAFPTNASLASDAFAKAVNGKLQSSSCQYKPTPRTEAGASPVCATISDQLAAHGGLLGLGLACRQLGAVVELEPKVPNAFDKTPRQLGGAMLAASKLAKAGMPNARVLFPINSETNPTRCLAMLASELKEFDGMLANDGGLGKAFPEGKGFFELRESSSKQFLSAKILSASVHPELGGISTCLGYKGIDTVFVFGLAKK